MRKLSFFAGVDWDHLLEVEPPFVPQPDNDADTTYFEGKEHFISYKVYETSYKITVRETGYHITVRENFKRLSAAL